jgi:hypothetical protein
MSDSYDDYEANTGYYLEDLYCTKHKGMWYHECGCEPPEDWEDDDEE